MSGLKIQLGNVLKDVKVVERKVVTRPTWCDVEIIKVSDNNDTEAGKYSVNVAVAVTGGDFDGSVAFGRFFLVHPNEEYQQRQHAGLKALLEAIKMPFTGDLDADVMKKKKFQAELKRDEYAPPGGEARLSNKFEDSAPLGTHKPGKSTADVGSAPTSVMAPPSAPVAPPQAAPVAKAS